MCVYKLSSERVLRTNEYDLKKGRSGLKIATSEEIEEYDFNKNLQIAGRRYQLAALLKPSKKSNADAPPKPFPIIQRVPILIDEGGIHLLTPLRIILDGDAEGFGLIQQDVLLSDTLLKGVARLLWPKSYEVRSQIELVESYEVCRVWGQNYVSAFNHLVLRPEIDAGSETVRISA